jgi:hypothetical protein
MLAAVAFSRRPELAGKVLLQLPDMRQQRSDLHPIFSTFTAAVFSWGCFEAGSQIVMAQLVCRARSPVRAGVVPDVIDEVSGDLVDMVDAGTAARTEHYEIAAYNGLIEMARALGESEAVGLLEENVKEEREALHEVESVAKKLRDVTKASAS